MDEAFQIGDLVRIARTPDTEAAGCADRVGTYYGWTMPSVSGVDGVGLLADFALCVGFEPPEEVWLDPTLILPAPAE